MNGDLAPLSSPENTCPHCVHYSVLEDPLNVLKLLNSGNSTLKYTTKNANWEKQKKTVLVTQGYVLEEKFARETLKM